MKDTKTDKPRIFRIADGIVIDHIPPFRSFDVAEMIGFNPPSKYDAVLAIGVNLRSQKHGAKDVMKIENRDLSKEELNRISIIAPHATISRIKAGEIVEKISVHVPVVLEGLCKCPNSNCVTNHEPVKTKFHYIDDKALCHFCEKTFELPELTLL